MEINDFLSQLNALCYDRNVLESRGLETEDVEAYIKAFYPEKKNYDSNHPDIIIRLIESYHTEFSLVSNISFNEEVVVVGEYIHIGWVFGEDPIAIHKTSNEIVTLTYWHYENVNFYCAKNSDCFLQAFVKHGIPAWNKTFLSEKDKWDHNRICANDAAILAGGEKYLPFWSSLFPVDDGKSKNPNESGFLN